ncbi:unnamed protein product [Cylicocyclus nassatus]|uniref:Transthyretin-like family protein n=1 Tax=Cylicocyclus nassatus TaxID=53992 RepID=A0AA36GZT9_CYLNA|nr:unnamed protein product [Cylicocyclus nassatus]
MRALIFLYLLCYCYVPSKGIIEWMTTAARGSLFCKKKPVSNAQITIFDIAPRGRRQRLSEIGHPNKTGWFEIEGAARKLFRPFLMVKHWCNRKKVRKISPTIFCIDIPSHVPLKRILYRMRALIFLYLLCYCYVPSNGIIEWLTTGVRGLLYCKKKPVSHAQIIVFDIAPRGRRQQLSEIGHPNKTGWFKIEGAARKLFRPFLMVKHWCNRKKVGKISPTIFCIDIPSHVVNQEKRYWTIGFELSEEREGQRKC